MFLVTVEPFFVIAGAPNNSLALASPISKSLAKMSPANVKLSPTSLNTKPVAAPSATVKYAAFSFSVVNVNVSLVEPSPNWKEPVLPLAVAGV